MGTTPCIFLSDANTLQGGLVVTADGDLQEIQLQLHKYVKDHYEASILNGTTDLQARVGDSHFAVMQRAFSYTKRLPPLVCPSIR
jgi:hypothetical protein